MIATKINYSKSNTVKYITNTKRTQATRLVTSPMVLAPKEKRKTLANFKYTKMKKMIVKLTKRLLIPKLCP